MYHLKREAKQIIYNHQANLVIIKDVINKVCSMVEKQCERIKNKFW